VLRFDPALPPKVKRLKFSVHYRGHRIDVDLVEDRLRLRSRPGAAHPIQVLVRDELVTLGPGEEREVSLEPKPSLPFRG
jgi:trehalose/maltose hydrolase-like predicted phosphorylase